MTKVKLASVTPFAQESLDKLKDFCDITVKELANNDDFEEECLRICSGSEIVVVGEQTVTRDMLKKLQDSGMKLMGCARGTPVNVDWEAIKEFNIPLIHSPGRSRHSVAEFTIGLMIAVTRHMVALSGGTMLGKQYCQPPVEDIYAFTENIESDVPEGYVHPAFTYGTKSFELYGRTLGLLGFGPIGREVCRLALAFNMEVIVFDPYISEERVSEFGGRKVELDYLLQHSHIISNHMAVTPETRGMIDKTWYAKMRKGIYIVNTGRAAVFDQKDFMDALADGTIAGAGLDVFWLEPLPANHPLWDMENVVITPHIAGVTMDMRTWQSRIITEDILRYCMGEALENAWTRVE